jgi:hypothetical protein
MRGFMATLYGDRLPVDKPRPEGANRNMQNAKIAVGKASAAQKKAKPWKRRPYGIGVMNAARFLCLGITVSAIASAGQEVTLHPGTANPAKTRFLQTMPVMQTKPGGSLGLEIGTNVAFVDGSGRICSSCVVRHPFVEAPRYPTTAAWNDREDMLAVHTGGRTWSLITFFSIHADHITALPSPHWDSFLPLRADGTISSPTRQYVDLIQWLDRDTCRVRLWGTAHAGMQKDTAHGPAEEHIDYDLVITLAISPIAVKVIEVREAQP